MILRNSKRWISRRCRDIVPQPGDWLQVERDRLGMWRAYWLRWESPSNSRFRGSKWIRYGICWPQGLSAGSQSAELNPDIALVTAATCQSPAHLSWFLCVSMTPVPHVPLKWHELFALYTKNELWKHRMDIKLVSGRRRVASGPIFFFSKIVILPSSCKSVSHTQFPFLQNSPHSQSLCCEQPKHSEQLGSLLAPAPGALWRLQGAHSSHSYRIPSLLWTLCRCTGYLPS